MYNDIINKFGAKSNIKMVMQSRNQFSIEFFIFYYERIMKPLIFFPGNLISRIITNYIFPVIDI